MRQLTRKTCDELVGIPMKGAVESLNVSVASAVCLYEAFASAAERNTHEAIYPPAGGLPSCIAGRLHQEQQNKLGRSIRTGPAPTACSRSMPATSWCAASSDRPR